MPQEEKMSNNIEGVLFATQQFPSLNEQDKQRVFQRLTDILKDPERTDIQDKVLNSLENLSQIYKPSGETLEAFKKQIEHEMKKEMEKMIVQQDEHWARIWQFIVKLLGCETHGSKGLLNSLLSVLEKAMKSKDNHTLVLAFNCWSKLIDNFALNLDILTAQRRVDLLTIPLKSKIAKDPDTMTAKFYTWWHLITQLKTGLEKHYSGVLKNFYLFCLGPFGKDSSVNLLRLSSRVPGLAHDILLSLTFSLGVGIPDIEEKLQKMQTNIEIPSVPIFPNSNAFALFCAELISVVTDYIITSPTNELSQLAFEALVHRIGQLQVDNEPSWQNAVTDLLKVVQDATKQQDSDKMQGHGTLVTYVIDVVLSTWSSAILDVPLVGIAATPRALLLDMLLQEECIMLNTKACIDKTEDRFVKLIRILLERKGSVIAGPNIVSDVGKITQALERTQTVLREGESLHITKLLNLWDQLSRVVVKVLPSETANEECNAISKKNLLDMLLTPLKLRLKYQAAKPVSNMTAHLATWKQLLTKYVEVSSLSLTLNKRDVGDVVSEEFLHLLKSDSYTTAVVLTFVQFTNQLISTHPPQVSGVCDDLKIIDLLTREAMLLEFVAIDDPAKSRKAANLLAKTLQSVMILHTSINILLKVLKIFYHILSIPSMKQSTNDENISELWKMFAHQFNTVASKVDNSDTRDLKCEFREHLPYITNLKSHYNIKVQQGAADLESTFDNIISRPRGRTSVAVIRQEEQKNSPVMNVFTPPSQSIIGRKRSRKQSLLPNALTTSAASNFSSPGSSATMSPARPKPNLEEEDSQDFVKIAPKTSQTKKVLTPHQRESKRRRRDDIPALYQGLSQDTFNSQDTQDTQDCVVVLSGAPVTSAQSICMDEDASDVDLHQKVSEQNKNTEEVKDEEEDMEEDVFFPNPFTPTKDDPLSSPMQSPSTSGRKSKRKQQFPSSDDEIMILEDTTSDKKVQEADKTSSNALTNQNIVEESQEVDIIENSQNIATFDIQEAPAVKIVDTETISKDQSKKQLRLSHPMQNRQGVSLPKRGTKILTDSSNKEKSISFQGRAISGRAAQMLEMANASREAANEAKSSPVSTPTREVKHEVLAFAESKLPSNTFIVPIGKLSETQVAAETSPDKTSTDTNFVSTPLSSVGKTLERRSNLKREFNQDGTPSPKRPNRRVSFAEPVVSSAKESPKILNEESTYINLYRKPSPIAGKSRGKSPKVSRKLLLPAVNSKLDGAGFVRRSKYRMLSSDILPSQGSQSTEVPGTSDAPIFPALVDCQESITVITTDLSSPMLESSIIEHLRDNQVITIGDLSSLSEISVNNLSIKEPKIQTVKSVLLNYATLMDEVPRHKDEDVEEYSPDVEEVKAEVIDMSESPEPLIEEPQDAEDSLRTDLNKLIEQHSLQAVLQALGRESDVFEHAMKLRVPASVVKNVVGDESAADMLQMLGREPAVLNHVLTEANPRTVMSKLTQNISIPGVLNALGRQSEVAHYVSKISGKRRSNAEIMKDLGSEEEVINFSVANSNPLALIEKAAQEQDMTEVLKVLGKTQNVLEHALATADPLEVISKVSDKVAVSDILQAVGRKEEVLAQSLAHNKPQQVMSALVNQLKVPEVLQVLDDSEVLQYVVSNTDPTVLIKKTTARCSVANVLKAIDRPEEVLSYCVANSTPVEVLGKISQKHSTSKVLQALGKQDEVLEAVISNTKTESVVSALKNKLGVEDIVKALGDKDKVLECAMTSVGSLTAVTRAVEMLQEMELNSVMESLDVTQQQQICAALPLQCLRQRLEEILNTKDAECISQHLLSKTCNSELISEFTQRCSKLKRKDLNTEQLKTILSIIPLNTLLEKIKTVLESRQESVELKKTVLKAVTCSELLNHLTENIASENYSFEQVEMKQVTDICNLMPLICINARVESILNNGSGTDADVFKLMVLQYASSLQLLEQLSKKEIEDSSETVDVRYKVLSQLLGTAKLEVVLQSVVDKLRTEKLNLTRINYLKTLATHLPNEELVSVVTNTELEVTEKYELFEHLMNCTPIRDIMSRLPIKDVISYYDNLIVMPESRAALIRSCLDKLSDEDLLRFCGAEKMLHLIGKEICCAKLNSVTSQQVAQIIPNEAIVTRLCEQLLAPKTNKSTMSLLQLHFPRHKLGELVNRILTE